MRQVLINWLLEQSGGVSGAGDVQQRIRTPPSSSSFDELQNRLKLARLESVEIN